VRVRTRREELSAEDERYLRAIYKGLKRSITNRDLSAAGACKKWVWDDPCGAEVPLLGDAVDRIWKELSYELLRDRVPFPGAPKQSIEEEG
jgi:hypothetical protein